MTEHGEGEDIAAGVDEFEAGRQYFEKVRELGQRGVFVVMHPYTGEHVDVVDFDEDNARRKAAGLEGYNFWSAPLPQVDN